MNPNSDNAPFGHRPHERVFGVRVSKPPSIRTRVAAPPIQGRLSFEPECDSQAQKIASALTPPPVPQSSLAFEPDEGEPLDRVSRRESARTGASQLEIDELLKLAAAGDDLPAPNTFEEPSRTAPSVRNDLTGDLEAEMFGPRGRRAPPSSAAVTVTAPSPTSATMAISPPDTDAARRLLADGEESDPGEATSRGGSWISVFLSDHVAGKKKRRRSTIFKANTAAVSGAIGKIYDFLTSRIGAVIDKIDGFTSRYRLPLGNIAWSILISALTIALGVSPLTGLLFFAVCLVLTIAGQSARHLLGYAGIIIIAAALAEIVRQRARFFEVFIDLFG